jgi:hypothetical protein
MAFSTALATWSFCMRTMLTTDLRADCVRALRTDAKAVVVRRNSLRLSGETGI